MRFVPSAARVSVGPAERPVTGTISAARLGHKAPRQALKEFRTAQRAAQDGDEENAVAHLRKAIEIDPEYCEAYNNLGAKLMRAGRVAQALEQAERALLLDPSAAAVLANFGAARLALRQYPQAEAAARGP